MSSPRTILAATATVLTALSAAACSAGSPASASNSSAARADAAAQPDTAQAAGSVAQQFFALYSAGQWGAAWQFLTPADRAKVPESLFVAFQNGCPGEAAGMAYSIEHVALAGTTAVVTYTIPVVAKLFGSATMAMAWAPAGWGVSLDASALKDYSHGSVKADIAAAKAAGECSGSA